MQGGNVNAGAGSLTDEKILATELSPDRKLFFVRTAKRVITFDVSVDPTNPGLVNFRNRDLGLELTVEDISSWIGNY